MKHKIREETLTDINLLDIEWAYPRTIRTAVYTRSDEGNVTGADWLWIVNFDQNAKPIALLIQAKLISQSGRCYTLPKRAAIGKPQIDLLEEFAKECGFFSFYCFYGTPLDSIRAQSCLICNLGKSDIDLMGCTLLNSSYVRKLMSKTRRPTIGEIFANGHSLACISRFCGPGPSRHSSSMGQNPLAEVPYAVRQIADEANKARELTSYGQKHIAQFLNMAEIPVAYDSLIENNPWSNFPLSIAGVIVMTNDDKSES